MQLEETFDRMKEGKLFYCGDTDLVELQLKYLDLVFEYNSLKPSKQAEKATLLRQMFGKLGKNAYIETPFYANWGGKNVYIGDNFYANFNLTLVDDGEIFIGDNVMIAPNVTIATATHPIDYDTRTKGTQFNLPVKICDNVWVGANSCILPNVTIGKNSVIGAGSVVTKDIPENVVAFGNPCVLYRTINENDKKYYYKDMEIDI